MSSVRCLILLISICLLCTSSAFALPGLYPLHPYTEPIASTRHHQSSVHFRSDGNAIHSPSSQTLHKRISIGDGWNVYWFDAPAYLPTEAAAQVFVGFYTQILYRVVQNALHDQPPLHRFSFRKGFLALSCHCARIPIPWDLLNLIITEMIDSTLKGYTGQYIAKFVHANGIEIDLDMSVGPRGPVLPSDALSSSGTPSPRMKLRRGIIN